ncbi:MAG: hypothetical protein V2A65_09005, partial [Candidatus Omnitrophota bacterium]
MSDRRLVLKGDSGYILDSARKFGFGLMLLVFLAGCQTQSVHYLSDARQSFQQKKYQESLEHYEKAPELKNNPKIQKEYTQTKLTYLNSKALNYGNQQDWDNLVKCLEEIVEIDENYRIDRNLPIAKERLIKAREKAADFHFKKGLDFASQTDLVRSVQELTIAHNYSPENVDIKKTLEEITATKKEREEKRESGLCYQKGEGFVSEKDWYRALNEFQEALQFNPEDKSARDKVSEVKGKIEEAEGYYSQANDLFSRKEWNKAISCFEKTLEISPFHPKGIAIKKAIEDAKEEITRAEITRAEACCRQGENYLSEMNWSRALNEFREALKIDPNSVTALNRIPKIEKVIKISEEYYHEGMDFLGQKKWEKAIACFRDTREISPFYPDVQKQIDFVAAQQEAECSATEKPTAAVIDLEAKEGISQKTSESLSESLRSSLHKAGLYRLLSRESMEIILKEQKFQLSGCTSTECVIKAGRLLG